LNSAVTFKSDAELDHQAKAGLAALVESSDDAIIGKTLDGIITDWNQGAQRIFGYAPEEAIGQPISMLIPPDRRAEEQEILARIAQDERVEHFETIRRAKDGHLIDVSLSVSPIRDQEGQIVGASKIARDISARKTAEAQRRESDERYRNLFTSMSEGFCLCQMLYDENGKPNDFIFLAINPAQEKILGMKTQDVVGKRVKEILPGLEDHWIQVLATPALTGEPVRYTNYVAQLDRYFDVYAYSPGIGQFAALAMDVTDRKKAEEGIARHAEALARSNTELERFAYIASHDLQEPLRTVSSFAKLLDRKHSNELGEEAKEYLKFITGGVERMETLIRDLLNYSRIDSRGDPFKKADCNAIVQLVTENLKASIDSRNAKITVDALPTLVGDPTQLGQVFQNLISNAVKFCKESEPHVHLWAKEDEENWTFSVHDNGIGIAPQYFQRIFIVFQRLHTIEEYSGTGIGLAICKKIVERHKGRIWVESTLGKGSTFHFTIHHPRHRRLRRFVRIHAPSRSRWVQPRSMLAAFSGRGNDLHPPGARRKPRPRLRRWPLPQPRRTSLSRPVRSRISPGP
jgi:PAS domain S-box-containing protein